MRKRKKKKKKKKMSKYYFPKCKNATLLVFFFFFFFVFLFFLFVFCLLFCNNFTKRPQKRMPRRHCAQCGLSLDEYEYSTNQWRKPIGVSRCLACVGNGSGGEIQSRVANTARRNNSSSANVDSFPFAKGGFRWVAKGVYTSGYRSGEACVCKWFQSGFVWEETFFDKDIQAMKKALDIIKEWNSRKYVHRLIKINIPEVWTSSAESDSAFPRGTMVLVEPFIENYQKFNSNTGWSDTSTPWPKVMQALSHFSYHASGGQFVLCDLQGGIYEDAIVLTDPVILSRNRRFGVTDLGPDGISSFFSSHRCNE